MKKGVKIQLYRIHNSDTNSVIDVCKYLINKRHEERLQTINGYSTRIENLTTTPIGMSVAMFCKQRVSGPGLSARTQATKDFRMHSDESFGEITFALFPHGTPYALIQYNHYGVRPSSIAKYLNSWPQGGKNILFAPVLKGDLMHRLMSANSVRFFETKFDFSGVKSIPPEMSQDIAATRTFQVMEAVDKDYAAQIDIKISKQRGHFLGMSIERVRKYLTSILSLSEEGILKSAKVSLEEEDSEHSGEVLDLLRAKEELPIQVEWDLSDGRMIPENTMHKVLDQAYTHWKNQRLIG